MPVYSSRTEKSWSWFISIMLSKLLTEALTLVHKIANIMVAKVGTIVGTTKILFCLKNDPKCKCMRFWAKIHWCICFGWRTLFCWNVLVRISWHHLVSITTWSFPFDKRITCIYKYLGHNIMILQYVFNWLQTKNSSYDELRASYTKFLGGYTFK